MSVLTILTQKHKQALKDILPEMPELHCDISKAGLYEMRCPRECLDIDVVAVLLEHIVILEHPVYGHSPKLADMAFELRNTEIHHANVAELVQYIEEHDVLHLEGYAAFRMSDYRHKLDMMMYCLIKKLKLTDSLLP